MALGFPFGFYVSNGVPLDSKYNDNGVPYVDQAAVLAALPIGVRYEGLKVRIGNADFEFAADKITLVPSGGGGGIPIELGALPNAGSTTVFTSDLGVDLAVPIMSFNNNAFSKNAAGGWLNLILGSGSGGSLNGGGANVILGNNNLPNLIGTSEFNGSQNVALGWDIADSAIAGSQNVFIGRQVSKGLLGAREYFYASLIGYEAGKGSEGLAANSLDGHTIIGTVAGSLSKFSNGYSTILGAYAGYNSPRIGNRATFIGYQAGSLASYTGTGTSTPGQNNTFVGYRAGYQSGLIDYGAGNTFSHSNNVFIGGTAGTSANVDRSTFVGVAAGTNAIGEKHFALGSESMQNLGASAHNGGVGNFAGWQNDAAGKLTGGFNYFFGEQSGYSIATLANTVNIGHYSKNTLSNSINIGGYTNAGRLTKMDVNLYGAVTMQDTPAAYVSGANSFMSWDVATKQLKRFNGSFLQDTWQGNADDSFFALEKGLASGAFSSVNAGGYFYAGQAESNVVSFGADFIDSAVGLIVHNNTGHFGILDGGGVQRVGFVCVADQFTPNNDTFQFFDNRITSKGIQYALDYTLTDSLSLLHKAQADRNYSKLVVPTSSAGLPSGAIWNNGGVLTIVP